MTILDNLFGHGSNLTMLQMSCRAFVMFFVTLVFIRISGMRAFGSKSAFDNVIVIMLGAVLSRGVVGASPIFSIIAAGFVLVIVHKLVGYISMNNDVLSHLVKSNTLSLYKDGEVNKKNMRACELSMGDLMSGVRQNANIASLDEAEEVFMERTGQISVIKKKQ